jgi:signal transduction histidine kinase
LILERVNIAQMVQNALDVGVSSVDRRRLDIEVVVDVPEDLEVETDRYRLLQILTNLMTNARKAVRLGTSPQRFIHVIGRQMDAGKVILTVEDNGIGMGDDHKKRLFQQGFTTWGDGTGIGLHSSALEARHIGATLSATSEGPGRGARFTIEIPPTPPPANRREKRSETGRIVQGGSS